MRKGAILGLPFQNSFQAACLKVWKYFFRNFVWINSSFVLNKRNGGDAKITAINGLNFKPQ